MNLKAFREKALAPFTGRQTRPNPRPNPIQYERTSFKIALARVIIQSRNPGCAERRLALMVY